MYSVLNHKFCLNVKVGNADLCSKLKLVVNLLSLRNLNCSEVDLFVKGGGGVME